MAQSSDFWFKQFAIRQSASAMKVGTDGVVLGAWFDVREGSRCCGEEEFRLLDIGCGTGLLSLMALQRNSMLTVCAIDIDRGACQDAQHNFDTSPWMDRAELLNVSFEDYVKEFVGQDVGVDQVRSLESGDSCVSTQRSGEREQKVSSHVKFDRIVCNPPYFTNSMKSPSASRNRARHDDALSVEDIIEGVSKLLNENGLFAIILPSSGVGQIKQVAALHGMYCCRELNIRPLPQGEIRRTAMEFAFYDKFSLTCQGEDRPQGSQTKIEELVIESAGRHVYSEEYVELTKEFYLKF